MCPAAYRISNIRSESCGTKSPRLLPGDDYSHLQRRAGFRSGSGRHRARRIADVLDRLDLLDKENVHPMALSGGQKQRLAIASCLLARREVLLMDEPTSGLDFSHMMEVTALLRGLADDGLVVCVVTHDGEFLERACDCVVEIDGGRP